MPFSRHRLWDLLAILALAAVVAGVYSQAARHGFFILDDNLALWDDARVAGGVTATNAARAFGLTGTTRWSPPAVLAHMAAFAAFGKNPMGHHLALVALHFLAALFLYLAFASMTGRPGRSAFVALLFAAHPANVEAVAWIAQYRTVCAALFLFLALFLYARYTRAPSRGRYAAVAGAFFLSVASDPVVAAMPLALLALDFWPLSRFRPTPLFQGGAGGGSPDPPPGSRGRTALGLVAEKLPLLALSSAVLTVGILGSPGFVLSTAGPGPAAWAAATATGLAGQLGLALFPLSLSILRPWPQAVSPAWAAACGALILLLTLVAAREARRRPFLLAGWTWFLLALAPVFALAPWMDWPPTAERFLYVPAVGVFTALAWLLAGALERSTATRALAASLAALAVAVSAWMAFGQVSLWKDTPTLLSHVLELDPRNCQALRLLGDDAADNDFPNQAMEHYAKSLALCPRQAEAYKGIADILAERGRYAEARELYRRALDGSPLYWTARHNLAAALAKEGRVAEAAEEFAATARLAPNDALTRLNLGMCLVQLGRLEEGKEEYEKAIAILPTFATAYLRLGDIFAMVGRAPDAARYYGMAIRMDPDLQEARDSFTRLLTGRDREDPAAWEKPAPDARTPDEKEISGLLALLDRDPENPVIHNNLGTLYEKQGDVKRAEFHLRRALVLRPGYAKAQGNLGVLLMHRGDFAEAEKLLADAAEREPGSVAPAYNLACLHSLWKNSEKSLLWLKEAARRGLAQRSLVNTDPDLAFLRENEDLSPILNAMP